MLRGPPLLILAIIALAPCLACPASASAQEPIRAEGSAGNLHKEPAREAAGIQQQDTRPVIIHPETVICVFPATPNTKAHEQRDPIPPGKQLKDLCPTGALAYLFSYPVPRVSLDTRPHETQPDHVKASP